VSGEATIEAAGGARVDADVIDAIFEASLLYARRRLKALEDTAQDDMPALDRAARTAHLFVRVAAEVDALSARKRKEHSQNAKRGAVTPEDIDRHEQELARRLSRYARELADGLAAGSAPPRARIGESGGA
jgi:hypothetical protein